MVRAPDPNLLLVQLRLSNDTQVEVRRIRPTDKRLLSTALRRLSDETVYRRFLSPKPSFSAAELRYLTEVDGWNHFALAGVLAEDPDRIIAVARFIRLIHAPDSAEFAVVVEDEYQGLGLGKALALMLADAARERGIEHFTASMLGENVAAHRLMRSFSERMRSGRAERGVQELVLDLAA